MAIHERFLPPTLLVTKQGFAPKVMSMVEPEVRDRVRKPYDGPLALAIDYMVFNVTNHGIRVRMSSFGEAVWSSPALKNENPPDFTKAIPVSDFTKSGARPFREVVVRIYAEINEI